MGSMLYQSNNTFGNTSRDNSTYHTQGSQKYAFCNVTFRRTSIMQFCGDRVASPPPLYILGLLRLNRYRINTEL